MTLLSQILASNHYDFPDPIAADPQHSGLIAMGADLAPATLLSAYCQGMFPWFNDDEPIAWWCPEPRCVIAPSEYQPSKSLRRTAKNAQWQITLNQAFAEVIQNCSLPRSYAEDTWIHEEMMEAYLHLHELGFAHSIEVWQASDNTADKVNDNIADGDTLRDENSGEGRQLIGGLYGLKIGSIYFGESMFHTVTDASKVAFWALMRLCDYSDIPLVDCQLPNPHLLSLGAQTLERQQFLELLPKLTPQQGVSWQANNFDSIACQSLLTDFAWQAKCR